MNYGLLWIDMLMIVLLWSAFVAACLGRLHRRWLRNTLGWAFAVIPLLPLWSFAATTGWIKLATEFRPTWFWYAFSLLLASMAGMALIARRGSRGEAGFALPAAASWPRGMMGCGFLAAVAIGYITLSNVDSAIRARCAILSIDLNSTYRALAPAIVSESQNAAPLYTEAFARLKGDTELTNLQNYPFGKYDTPFDPKDPATLRVLAREAGTIQLLRKAAAMPCRFDQDMESPDLNSMTKSLSGERLAADFLWLDALQELAHGHVATANEDTVAVLNMGRQFTPRPLVIGAEVGMGIDNIGVKMLETTLPAAKTRQDVSALPDQPIPSLRPYVQQSLRGEEAWGLAFYGNFSPSSPSTGSTRHFPRFLIGGSLGPADLFWRAFFLDLDDYAQLLGQARQWTAQPYFEVAGPLNSLENRRPGVFASLVAPSIADVVLILNRLEATDAGAAVAIAITHYRIDHGRMPANLASLVPGYLDALPIDPFDGKPIRLAKKADRWIIYSVGPDGVDNGGAPYNWRDETGDLIFTLKLASG